MPGDGSVGALALGVPWAARHRADGGLRLAQPLRADFGLRPGFCAAIFVLWRGGELPTAEATDALFACLLASVLQNASSHFSRLVERT